MRAWYFSNEERKLRYNDYRPIVVGETHSVDITSKPLELCAWGLHASVNILDALKYAPGNILYEVELSGQILVGDDKVCAEHRTYIREYCIEDILIEFARKQALINIEKIKPYTNEAEYSLIIEWLTTGNVKVRSAAASAAWSAADNMLTTMVKDLNDITV